MKILITFWAVGWRSLVVAIGYLATLIASGIVGGMLGLLDPAGSEGGAGVLGWALLAGFLMGVFLGPLAARMPLSRWRHCLVWTSAIFLNLSSVAIEGVFFAPELVTIPLPILLGQQLLASAVAASLITMLFSRKDAAIAPAGRRISRSWLAWGLRFLVASASYLLFYAVFGLINYTFVTEPYYASHAGGLTVPEPALVWLVEAIRAPLIALSVMPFVCYSRGERKPVAITTGLLLFWIGGVVPLMFQASMLPPVLVIASAVEIFFQNFCMGAVIAWLFWARRVE